MTFHDQIKASSDAAHAEAENAPFISSLMAGSLTQVSYRDYLAAFLPIYKAMESLLHERNESQILGYFNHKALDRSEYIAHDLATLNAILGSEFDGTSLHSVKNYLQRLGSEISDARLLAHHYIRYLGDLSGGQAISKLVSRHYSISDDALTFYNFTNIGDAVYYKKRYRDLLNLAPLTSEEKSEFLDEVTHLYRLSTDIFIELGITHSAVAK